MTPRSDDPLRHSFEALEGQGASVGFTQRVMERLARRKTRRRRRIAVTSISALAALAVGLLTLTSSSGPTRADLTAEALQLQREYAQLQSELDALRTSAQETAPVLYLGGDDEMDLVLDLAPIITQPAPAAVPVSAVQIDPYEL